MGEFVRRRLRTVYFARPVRFSAFTVEHMTSLRTVAREFGAYEDFSVWISAGLTAHAARLSREEIERRPELARLLQTQAELRAAAVAQRANLQQEENSDEDTDTEDMEAPGTPTHQQCHSALHTTGQFEEPPEMICFMTEVDLPDNDDKPANPDLEDDSYSDDDTHPPLCSGSESDDGDGYSSDKEHFWSLPRNDQPELADILAQPHLTAVQTGASTTPALLGVQECSPDVVTPPNIPTRLEAHALPQDEACSFPDDDALTDNRHLTFGAMVDYSNLTEDQATELINLLEVNMDVFCFHPTQLGTCSMGVHVIDTGDAAPIKQRYYKLPHQKQEQLKAHVEEWLKLGLCFPSSSPWASPLHIVPKKNGDTRPVIDFRKLNDCTKKDAYPLPRIDDILHNIGTARYFSCGDLFQGYFQIPLAGADGGPDPHNTIDKSSFITPFGTFSMRVLPFGLCNGPATFMRVVNEVLKPYIGKFLFVFLDDVVIFSSDWSSHLSHLKLFFAALREANLKLAPSKSHFATSCCTFLGFKVSSDGLSCDPRLIEAIAARPAPYLSKNPKKAVLSFLGLCGFYRRFVKNYAAIAEPLTRLTAKNQPFVWGDEQQEAFDTLKAKLMAYPILRRPDFSRHFFLHTDASMKAVGAVLTQKDDDGREYAVAYHSAKLTPTQRNWGITHLECYAVVNAVCDHFKDILLGHEFTIITDHSALKWLMTCPHLQGKLARWSLRLQEFLPFSIQYRKGAQHVAADAMSRDPQHEDTTQRVLDQTQATLLTLDTVTAQETTPAPEGQNALTNQGHMETDDGPPDDIARCSEGHRTPTSKGGDYEDVAVRISIEGNIGCGKTSVMQRLQRLQEDPYWDQWFLLTEPVADWHSLLEPFYGAPAGSTARNTAATVLQLAVLNSYALRVPNEEAAPLTITERSPWSSLAVFLPAQELPPHMEAVVNQAAHHMHLALDKALPTAIVYLRTDPSTCLDRIRQRQRPGEECITLEYLQELHQQYDEAIAHFPGPTVVIDSTASKDAVYAAVKSAVQFLHNRSVMEPIPPQHPEQLPRSAPRHRWELATPFPVHQFTDLQRLCPGQLLTTLDLFYLRLFPDQMLTLEQPEESVDSGIIPGTPDTHPQGTPADTPSEEEPTGKPGYGSFDYLPTSLDMLYNKDTEVPALFQAGPGKFDYSPLFCVEYGRRFGHPVDVSHRIDNPKALELYAALGPALCNGRGANIMVAIAPKKSLPALRVIPVGHDGTETVFVDSDIYAMHRLAELRSNKPPSFVDTSFSWEEGFRSEAYALDGWIRFVRLRPTMHCGVVLHNPAPPALLHNSVQPVSREQSSSADMAVPPAVRLASSLPHSGAAGDNSTTPSPPDIIAMLDEGSRPPQRKSARTAVKRMRGWANAQRTTVCGENDVDSNLPCQVCGSPNDWNHMLLCHRCDEGYHTYCIGLEEVPEDPWVCFNCLHLKRTVPTVSPSPPASEDSSYKKEDTTHTDAPDSSPASEEPLQVLSEGRQQADSCSHGVQGQESDGTDNAAKSSESASEDEEEQEHQYVSGAILEIWKDEAALQYLKTQAHDVETLPELTPGKEMKRIEKRAGHYSWDHQQQKLFKTPSGKYTDSREVPAPDTRPSLIDRMHQDLGHLGPSKLTGVLLARYYWRGIHRQVRDRLRSCDSCLRHTTLFKIKPPLKPLPPSRIWERVSMDSMGPYPPTKSGARYCCVAIDAMSKWVECWATPKLDSATMKRFFLNQVYAQHGLPKTVLTDQGKEFQHHFADLMKEWGVHHLKSAAYNPQSNGQAEAAVKTILHGLQKSVGDNPNEWDEKLPHVLIGLRSATHSTTGFSPFYINTGRHPVLPTQRRLTQPHPVPYTPEAPSAAAGAGPSSALQRKRTAAIAAAAATATAAAGVGTSSSPPP
jgi:thymidylate kinase